MGEIKLKLEHLVYAGNNCMMLLVLRTPDHNPLHKLAQKSVLLFPLSLVFMAFKKERKKKASYFTHKLRVQNEAD